MIFDNRDNPTSQVIRAIAGLRSFSIAELAKELGTSRQNLNGKLSRNNFSEKELKRIGEILGFNVVISWEEQAK